MNKEFQIVLLYLHPTNVQKKTFNIPAHLVEYHVSCETSFRGYFAFISQSSMKQPGTWGLFYVVSWIYWQYVGLLRQMLTVGSDQGQDQAPLVSNILSSRVELHLLYPQDKNNSFIQLQYIAYTQVVYSASSMKCNQRRITKFSGFRLIRCV